MMLCRCEFRDDLINLGMRLCLQHDPLVIGQLLPDIREFRLAWVLDDKAGVNNLEAGAFEQRLDVPHAEESDVGLVQQSPFTVTEIVDQKTGHDRRMCGMRDGYDYKSVFADDLADLAQRRPWIK